MLCTYCGLRCGASTEGPLFFICRNHNISSNKWRGAKPWSKQLKKCNWNEKQRHRRPQKKRTTPSSCVSLPSRGGYFYWARSRPCFWMMWSGVGCVSRGDGYDISALCEDWWGFGEREQSSGVWCTDQWRPTCCCCCHRPAWSQGLILLTDGLLASLLSLNCPAQSVHLSVDLSIYRSS